MDGGLRFNQLRKKATIMYIDLGNLDAVSFLDMFYSPSLSIPSFYGKAREKERGSNLQYRNAQSVTSITEPSSDYLWYMQYIHREQEFRA